MPVGDIMHVDVVVLRCGWLQEGTAWVNISINGKLVNVLVDESGQVTAYM